MSQEAIKRLDREHFARRLFSELALFYRGTVLLLHGAACKHSSNPVRSERAIQWYTQLIAWSDKCGHPDCKEQLKAEFRPDARTQLWGISVGVKDVRLGNPEVR